MNFMANLLQMVTGSILEHGLVQHGSNCYAGSILTIVRAQSWWPDGHFGSDLLRVVHELFNSNCEYLHLEQQTSSYEVRMNS